MAQAKHDQNDIALGLGVDSTDNTTPLAIRVDPVTSYLLVLASRDSLTATAATQDKIDENDVHTKYGVSSVDGVTLVPIRTDSSGRILVKFT